MRFKKTGDDYQTLKDDGLWKVMQDNPKFNHLESFHNFLKKNFKIDEIKNIILEDYEDIGDIIN